MGYEDMTPIQEQTIPHIIADKDVMGLARNRLWQNRRLCHSPNPSH